jgi:hypothetical protein
MHVHGTPGRLAAAVTAGLAGLVLAAAPAKADAGLPPWDGGCNSSHGHCWIYSNHVEFRWLASDAYMSASTNTWEATIYNHLEGSTRAPWIDVVTPNGRHLSYPGLASSGSSVTWKKGYPIVSWRLCDPNAGGCTAFVRAP